MIITCRQCQYQYSIDASLRQNSDLFVTGTCPKCNTKYKQCLLCSKNVSISSSKNNYRQIKAHVRVCQESRDHCDNQLSFPSNRKVRPSEIKLTQKYPTRADQNSPPASVHRAVLNNYLCPVDLIFTWMTTVSRYAA